MFWKNINFCDVLLLISVDLLAAIFWTIAVLGYVGKIKFLMVIGVFGYILGILLSISAHLERIKINQEIDSEGK